MAIEVARVSVDSTAVPERFLERWCDLETHPEWAPSMEYFRLDGPFGLGAQGVLKTRAGGESRFEVTALEPGRVYADTTFLDGAALTVHHEAVPHEGGSRVTVHASLEGPQAPEWAERMGDGVQRDIERDVATLARLLEGG